MTDFVRDLRYAGRRFRRSSGFATAAIVTLALGIGANTAIFTVMRGIMWEPFKYHEPDRVVAIWEDHRALGGRAREMVATETYRAWANLRWDQIRLAAYVPHRARFDAGAGVEHARTLEATPGFFQVLGLKPAMGRLFTGTDATLHSHPVFVATHDFFTTVLGADDSWIGRTVDLDGVAHTLAGVLPRDAYIVVPGAASGDIDIVVPWVLPEGPCPSSCEETFVVGRLAPGSGVTGVRDMLAAALGTAEPGTPTVAVIPLREELTAAVGPTLVILLVGVGLILLIACVNVANLLVARGPARDAEIAVRSALGAKRGRILRQLLTENALLTFLGGAAGLWVAAWAVDLVLASAPAAGRVPRAEAIGIDGVAIAFCAGVTVLTGIVLGIVPVVQSARPRVAAILHSIRARGLARARESESARALIVVEVAAAGVLLLSAGVLIRNYIQLERSSTGYDLAHVVTVDVPLDVGRSVEAPKILDVIERRTASLPGIVAAAAGVPPAMTAERRERIGVGAGVKDEQRTSAIAWVRPVTPSYFRFFGLDVVAGTAMSGRDAGIAVVNLRFATTTWPDAQAVGRLLRIGELTVEVVGVVEDGDAWAPTGTDRPAVYVPIDLAPPAIATIMVAAEGDADEAVPAIRAALSELSGTAGYAEIVSFGELAQGALGDRRLATLLLGVFAATAVALAAVGLIGVLHYGVTRRRYEMGIRMALGATESSLRNRVIWQGVMLTLVGAAVGVVVTLALRRVLSATVYGVASTDLVVFTTAPLVLCAIAVVASYVPARTVSRIEPVIILRGE